MSIISLIRLESLTQIPVKQDISHILNDWAFRPEDVTVRLVDGADGMPKIQLRLDLGLLQMNVDGRPDGRRIHGHASWLDYHQHQQLKHDAANPDAAPYLLEPEDCVELMREGVQYYHRYLSFWHLEKFELCARDTERNLRLFRFVREHARQDRDKLQFDQWRPYVTMMHARAVAAPLVQLEQWEAALGAVDAGIRAIERFLADYHQEAQADRVGELLFLQRLRQEIAERAGIATEAERKALADPITRLRDELAEAISDERYEDAGRLRDEISRLEEPPPPAL